MIRRLLNSRVRSALLWIIVAAGPLFALSVVDASVWDRELTTTTLGLLAGAVALLSASVVGLGVAWRMILQGLADRPVDGGVRVFVYTWLARYIPGTVPYHAARLLAADSLGVTRGQVGASIGYEAILVLGMAGLAGVVGIVVGVGLQTGNALLYVTAGLFLGALPLALHPAVLVPMANRLLIVAGRPPLAADAALTAKQTFGVAITYGAVLLATGLSFYLVAQAVTDEPPNIALAIGAYCLASAIGMAAPFVPSGLGVREGVVVALLSGTMPADTVLVAAGTARAVSIVADILPPALLAGFDLMTRARTARRRQDISLPGDGAGLEAGGG